MAWMHRSTGFPIWALLLRNIFYLSLLEISNLYPSDGYELAALQRAHPNHFRLLIPAQSKWTSTPIFKKNNQIKEIVGKSLQLVNTILKTESVSSHWFSTFSPGPCWPFCQIWALWLLKYSVIFFPTCWVAASVRAFFFRSILLKKN